MSGLSQILSSFGGSEILFVHYPHLQCLLSKLAYFETLWPVLDQVAVTKPRNTSRRVLELICDPSVGTARFYNLYPSKILLSIWDITTCAAAICKSPSPLSPANLQTRESILHDILAFRPEHGREETHNWQVDSTS